MTITSRDRSRLVSEKGRNSELAIPEFSGRCSEGVPEHMRREVGKPGPLTYTAHSARKCLVVLVLNCAGKYVRVFLLAGNLLDCLKRNLSNRPNARAGLGICKAKALLLPVHRGAAQRNDLVTARARERQDK